MSGTPTVRSQILSRLTSDSAVTTLLTGGIYDREIKRLGDGNTPSAFAPTPPYQPRPAAVVTDATDERDALGPGGAFFAFPWIYLYAEPHANGKTAIAEAWDLMFSRLHGWRFATGNGTGCEVRVIGRLGVMDDEPGSDRLVGGMRLQVTGLWRVTDS